MTWEEIGRDHLAASKLLIAGHPRSAVSRAYYGIHAVLTGALVDRGYVPAPGRETPPHDAQANLIGRYLSALGRNTVRDLRRIVRRTHRRRLDADYHRSAAVELTEAREAVRDASSLFALLGVKD